MRLESQHPVCDFCSAGDPAHRIRVKTFDIEYRGQTMQSEGDWMACDSCFRFVQADDHEGLFQHVSAIAADRCQWMLLNVDRETAETMREVSDEGIRMIQDLFWAKRL